MPSHLHRIVALALCVASALSPSPLRAHPLEAEAINHPYVFCFDQFNLSEDPDESLIPGGLLLIAELRCTACHAAPTATEQKLAAAPAPVLAGVGSRLDEDTLWLWVRSPQSRKRGTLMPGLFSNAEGDDEKVEAIATYLSSLKKAAPAMPAGDALRGKTLYHQVGCVACHQPANDVAPPGVAGGEEFEKPGNASVPIALADAWEINSLAAFLHDPLPLRPAGRMPAQALTQQEAADIAAYLHIEPKVPNAEQRKLLDIPKQSPQRGAELMKEMRCNNCHSADKTAHHAALPMVALRASAAGSCLDAGQVRYGLNDLQRRALALALSHLQKNEPTTADLLSASNFTMMRLNCYACHDYDGKGGPELPRAAYFSTTPDTLPPTLDGIGSRLSVEALQDRVWHGKGPKNAALQLRMPIFGQQPTQGLLKDLARQPQ